MKFLEKIVKFGRNCEGFVGFGWFGMVWQRLCNECWKRLCNPEQSVSHEGRYRAARAAKN